MLHDVTLHVTLKKLYFIIVHDMLQHVTPTFKRLIVFLKAGVTCCNMSKAIVKYNSFGVTCSVTIVNRIIHGLEAYLQDNRTHYYLCHCSGLCKTWYLSDHVPIVFLHINNQ